MQRVLKNTEGQPPHLCHKRFSLCGALRKVQTGLEGLDLLLHPPPGILHPSFILIDSQNHQEEHFLIDNVEKDDQ